ncbi:hypothetical protein CK203_046323 [Vitis vinifera]|uniref:Uncharacterized protein n=1 Tax=Vitis vinifera TaxID=29760 RepID=A0A438FW89_VITVI|nr:hypothetical protein CK203_046323 [Vitis vinifera]
MWKILVRGIPLGARNDDMRAEGRGEHVIQPSADGANGWLVWEGVAQVVAIGGLDLPGFVGLVLRASNLTTELLLSQDILILVLVEALSLLLGPLNADVEEALMLKPGCVIQFSSLNLSVSWRRAFSCHGANVDTSSPDDPRSCRMDGHAIQPTRFLIQSLYLQKTSGQGVRTHPPMVLLAMMAAGHHHPTGGCQKLVGDAAVSEIVGSDYVE